MSCVVEIKDVVEVLSADGTINAVPNLSIDETAGILAGLAKDTEQASNVITVDGLGSYGLTLQDLQQTGVVKKGLNVSYSPLDLAAVLADPSVFTGKYGVTSVDDLLNNEELQRELINKVMVTNVCDLRFQGVITGNETAAELAALAGMAAKFSPANIKAKLLGTVSDALNSAMDKIGNIAKFGAVLTVIKSADILGKLKGIGAATVKLPDLAIGTIDTANIDAGVDKLVGSLRIQSPAEIAALAAVAAQALRKGLPVPTSLSDIPTSLSGISTSLSDVSSKLSALSPKDYNACSGDS